MSFLWIIFFPSLYLAFACGRRYEGHLWAVMWDGRRDQKP